MVDTDQFYFDISANMEFIGLFWLILVLIFVEKEVSTTPIVGGNIIKDITKYPYMVSLQEEQIKGFCTTEHSANCSYHLGLFQHFCGGSLLNNRWILTAAHCTWWKDRKRIFAVIGQEDLTMVNAGGRYALERIEYIYFDHTNIRNDIALLRLQRQYIIINHYIKNYYAKLPVYGMNIQKNESCSIIGYGANQYAGDVQNKLSEGRVKIITKKNCREILGRILAPQKEENTICALGDQDTCQGDSGGPLICSFKGIEYIYGIVSHGLTCGIKGMPSIYTVTMPYIEWIKLIIND